MTLDDTQQGLNHFRKELFALDAKLTLKQNSGKRDLEPAMKGHVLAQAEWMGRYGRK